MATSCRGRREVVPATPPKFFKIILNPESDTLRIPKEFTRRHGPDLRNRVFLKVLEGSAMEVELIETNGETWLQEGWLKFKERYSIGFGYLLVFIYNGNSQFDVVIFDTTATEITYPVEETQSESESEDDDSVVILENLEASRNPLAPKQECKKRKRSSLKSKTVAKETSIAYQKALAHKCGAASSNASHQQPFFISLMQQSYVSNNFILTVPASVIMTSFPCNGTKRNTSFPNLYLIMNGRKWCVKCWVKPGFKSAKISRGWKKFAQDNGLKVGDVCIFEARKRIEFVWDVMVFRS